MAIFSCEFGNVVVKSNGEEIEATVPDCSYCRVECPYEYCDGCLGCKPLAQKCQYFKPDSDHVFWNNQWWS